jgi:Ca-activated chloride channel family protein
MCRLALLLCLLPLRLLACEVALVLAVDVSGSVDSHEYDIQMRGLAHALDDGAVSEALVRLEARVALVQWTGSSRQEVTLPWRTITSFDDTAALARDIVAAPRAWRHFSTAIGEALMFSTGLFAEVPDCRRRVIDLSGDGLSNEGPPPDVLRPLFDREGVTVNALAIEGAEEDLTAYFFERVIWGAGAFVATADGYADYPARIREKLLRELTDQTVGQGAPAMPPIP